MAASPAELQAVREVAPAAAIVTCAPLLVQVIVAKEGCAHKNVTVKVRPRHVLALRIFVFWFRIETDCG